MTKIVVPVPVTHLRNHHDIQCGRSEASFVFRGICHDCDSQLNKGRKGHDN